MRYWYPFVFILAVLICLPAAPFLLFLGILDSSWIHERFGIYGNLMKRRLNGLRSPLWVHAASVGEVRLLLSVPGFPAGDTLITCTTSAGRITAGSLFPSAVAVLMPLDLVFLHRRLIRLSRPSRLCIMETELWPGMIQAAKRIPVAIFNGRLSDGKIAVYRRFKGFLARLLETVEEVYASDSRNLERFREIGISPERLRLLGNLKYIYTPPSPDTGDPRYRKTSARVIVCGSTHRGEENVIADVFLKLQKEFPDIALIISPRSLGRLDEVRAIIKEKGIDPLLWSGLKEPVYSGAAVIVDTLGELSAVYSLAAAAFIGGSMVPHGGHNMIEAAAWGVPLVAGRHNNNFREPAELFSSGGGMAIANDAEDLYNELRSILKDPVRAAAVGDSNLKLYSEKKEEALALLKKTSLYK